MRLLGSIVALITLCFCTASSALAQCYGDMAHMYGCAPTNAGSQKTSGELVYFGASSEPVLPYRGPAPASLTDDLFSPEERRSMLRSIVRGNGSRSLSQAAELQAMTNGARPLRRARNIRVTAFGR